ncbi:hypothetical protein [Pseudaestuariivita sp.]|uniref:hypothetical protein n=1 Tax=Pseudaestuariivita sp. TaxID=2211669 RepID=UPI004057E681
MTEGDAAPDIPKLLRGIARPALIWTAHFIFVYAALSAACADRGVVSYGIVDLTIVIITIPAVVAAGWSIFRSGKAELAVAARWTGIISVVAILFTAAPALLMNSCG